MNRTSHRPALRGASAMTLAFFFIMTSTRCQVVERGYEGDVAKDERGVYEGEATRRGSRSRCRAGPTATTAGGVESDRPADAEAGERSRLDGEPADLGQRLVLMAIPTWRRSGP
jgi:hypothetical protein